MQKRRRRRSVRRSNLSFYCPVFFFCVVINHYIDRHGIMHVGTALFNAGYPVFITCLRVKKIANAATTTAFVQRLITVIHGLAGFRKRYPTDMCLRAFCNRGAFTFDIHDPLLKAAIKLCSLHSFQIYQKKPGEIPTGLFSCCNLPS